MTSYVETVENEALRLDGVTKETLDNFKDNKGDEKDESR